MDKVSRKSGGAKSTGKKAGGTSSRRSRSAGPKSDKKSTNKKTRSRKSTGRYSKLRDQDDETEMVDLNALDYGGQLGGISKIGAAASIRPHDIYENT